MLRPGRKPYWVSSSFGSIISVFFQDTWHTSFQWSYGKWCPGSRFIRSCLLFLCMGMISLPVFQCSSKSPWHLTHTSQSNQTAFYVLLIHSQNISQSASSSDFVAVSESLLMHTYTEAYSTYVKFKHTASRNLSVEVRRAGCFSWVSFSTGFSQSISTVISTVLPVLATALFWVC